MVLLLLLAGGALSLAYFPTQTVAPKVATATAPPLKGHDAERRASIQNPPTRVIERSRKKNAIATFAVETVAGNDYLVKLVNMSDPKDQVVIYVRGGDTYSIKVPLGRYHVRAATGTTWYGKNDLFGPETRFFRFIDQSPTPTERLKVFHLRVQDRRIMGVKVIFRQSVLGDMLEESISRDDFVN